MIATSRRAKLMALLLAFSAHGALAVALFHGETPVEIEGSGGAQQARLGSSFADMAAGTLSAESPQETVATAPPAATPAETLPRHRRRRPARHRRRAFQRQRAPPRRLLPP